MARATQSELAFVVDVMRERKTHPLFRVTDERLFQPVFAFDLSHTTADIAWRLPQVHVGVHLHEVHLVREVTDENRKRGGVVAKSAVASQVKLRRLGILVPVVAQAS